MKKTRLSQRMKDVLLYMHGGGAIALNSHGKPSMVRPAVSKRALPIIVGATFFALLRRGYITDPERVATIREMYMCYLTDAGRLAAEELKQS